MPPNAVPLRLLSWSLDGSSAMMRGFPRRWPLRDRLAAIHKILNDDQLAMKCDAVALQDCTAAMMMELAKNERWEWAGRALAPSHHGEGVAPAGLAWLVPREQRAWRASVVHGLPGLALSLEHVAAAGAAIDGKASRSLVLTNMDLTHGGQRGQFQTLAPQKVRHGNRNPRDGDDDDEDVNTAVGFRERALQGAAVHSSVVVGTHVVPLRPGGTPMVPSGWIEVRQAVGGDAWPPALAASTFAMDSSSVGPTGRSYFLPWPNGIDGDTAVDPTSTSNPATAPWRPEPNRGRAADSDWGTLRHQSSRSRCGGNGTSKNKGRSTRTSSFGTPDHDGGGAACMARVPSIDGGQRIAAAWPVSIEPLPSYPVTRGPVPSWQIPMVVELEVSW